MVPSNWSSGPRTHGEQGGLPSGESRTSLSENAIKQVNDNGLEAIVSKLLRCAVGPVGVGSCRGVCRVDEDCVSRRRDCPGEAVRLFQGAVVHVLPYEGTATFVDVPEDVQTGANSGQRVQKRVATDWRPFLCQIEDGIRWTMSQSVSHWSVWAHCHTNV